MKVDGPPVPNIDSKKADEWLNDHLDADQEPLEHVGYGMFPRIRGDHSTDHMCRLYEGPAGVIAINEDYAVLLDGLMPVQICIDVRESAPVAGVDDKGVIWCWIMPTLMS